MRSEAKMNMLVLAFSKYRNNNPFKDLFKVLFPTVMDHIDNFKKIKKDHRLFAVELQLLESEIFIDNLYVTLKEQGLFCITKHDSLLVRKDDELKVTKMVRDFFGLIEMQCTIRVGEREFSIGNGH